MLGKAPGPAVLQPSLLAFALFILLLHLSRITCRSSSFSLVAAVFVALGLAAGIPVVAEFAQTGYVNKVPSAILAVGLVSCGALAFSTGCILDTVAKATRKRWELDVYRAEDEMRRRQR